MLTSKHIDRLCITVTAVMLVIALLSMGMTAGAQGQVMGYEERLFETGKVHTIDIVMDDWDSFIETCENEEYASCAVVIDGESMKNVAIRAKGNTSLNNVRSMNSQRYSLKLEFDHYQEGNTYYGLDKLCLNNLIQDNTMMKDYIVYRLMDEFGVDAPLCSFAYVTVNGEDWGLFLAVEGVEDSFLQRNYGRETGELYKPDSMSFGGGRGNGRDFSFSDFETEAMPQMPQPGGEQGDMPPMPQMSGEQGDMPQMPQMGGEQDGMPPMPQMGGEQGNMPQMPQMPDRGGFGGGMGSSDVKLQYTDDDVDSYSNIFDNAKTDITEADKERLIASLKKLSAYEDIESIVDIDEVLRYFVVHGFVCNGDSYTGSMVHNYYLRESDGVLSMIPWDYNLAFGTFEGGNAQSSVNTSIDELVSGSDARPMADWIFSDEKYTEMYHELYREFSAEWLESGKLTALIEDTASMIDVYVQKDPTKFCTFDEYQTGVTALKQYAELRSEAVISELNGENYKVDTSGLNLSDMGTMNNGFGGGDRQNRDRSSFGRDDFSFDKSDSMPQQKTVNNENLLLTGISILVLLLGLGFAFCIKH